MPEKLKKLDFDVSQAIMCFSVNILFKKNCRDAATKRTNIRLTIVLKIFEKNILSLKT